MSKEMGNLGRKLREMMPDYFAQTEPFEGSVYKMGKKGDPIIKAPNGDSVVINDYNALEKPRIEDRVKIIVTRDGKGGGYSFGKLLEVYSTEQSEVYPTAPSILQNLIERWKTFRQRNKK